MKQARLLLKDKRIAIDRRIGMGRHREADIPIADGAASRQHAVIDPEASGAVFLEDLGSANGTCVNGTRISGRIRLQHGDRITIGDFLVEFLQPEEEAEPAVAADPVPAPAEAAAHIEPDPPPPPVAATVPPEPTSSHPNDLIGQTVAGYRIGGVIGRGLASVVFKARQLRLDRDVAFKVFHANDTTRSARFREGMLAATKAAAALHHEGLVLIHECGIEQGLVWLAMELIQGNNLADLLRNHRDGLDPQQALALCQRIAQALEAAHLQGICHGDLRPSKVVLTSSGKVKVLDTGLSAALGSSEPRTMSVQSAAYLSPERSDGRPASIPSDIYALGCLYHHLLLGRPPFSGDDPAAIQQAHRTQPVPSLASFGQDVDGVVQGMLAKNPDWRFSCIGELLQDLEKIRLRQAEAAATGAPQPVRTPRIVRHSDPSLRSPPTQVRATRRVMFLGIGVGLAMAVGLALLVLRPLRAPGPPVTGPGVESTSGSSSSTPGKGPDQVGKPVPAVNVLESAWQELQSRIIALEALPDWSQAEYLLGRFKDKASGSTELTKAIASRLRQVELNSSEWYRKQITLLPPADDAHLKDRFRRIAALRDLVHSRDRSDAESRWREVRDQMLHTLAGARRQAVQHLERGELTALPILADRISTTFAETPVMAVQQQFSAQLREAAAIRWLGRWSETLTSLPRCQGAAALPAAAGLLLTGDRKTAVAMLLKDPALEQEPLAGRRRSLLSSQGLVLSFSDPGDLVQLSLRHGDPAVANGSLTGAAGTPAGFDCEVDLSSPAWDAAIVLSVVPEAGQEVAEAILSLGRPGQAVLQLRCNAEGVHVRVLSRDGQVEQDNAPIPATGLRIRAVWAEGRLRLELGDHVVLSGLAVDFPTGTRLSFDVAGCNWRIDEIQAISGS